MDPQMFDSIAQLGIMNKMTSGNMYLDVAACMLVPFLIRYLAPYWDLVRAWMATYFAINTGFERVIEVKLRDGYDCDHTRDNLFLQEAILLYIGSQTHMTAEFKNADVSLYQSDGGYHEDDYSSDDGGESSCGTQISGEVVDDGLNFKMNTEPAENLKIEVLPGVFFSRTKSVEDVGKDGHRRETTILFTLRSALPDAHQQVQSFMEAAVAFHTAQQRKKYSKDTSRSLYMPIKRTSNEDDGDQSSGTLIYKKYLLSEEKTFGSFFHPEKASLLQLVDHFLNKTGKFAIPGYPHKLGLLLHGPPGTGKTSLIKALAHYTKRSVVAVPLNRISTNQELMDIVFDQSFLVKGSHSATRLPHSKVLFILEDVDAAGSAVLKRTGKDAVKVHPMSSAGPVEIDQEQAVDTMSMDEVATTIQQALTEAGKTDEVPFSSAVGPSNFLKTPPKDFGNLDSLNLAGILNVLDGVVDCPNRIVIMTTNHPEKLDPALIRPGRINKKIYMGYVTPQTALQMIRHYFPDAKASDLDRFEAAVPADALSPAKLEAMCSEYDELPALIDYIDRSGGLLMSGMLPPLFQSTGQGL